jgi:histidinol dehydrogenase
METFNYSDLSKVDISRLVQRNVDPANEIRDLVEDVIAHVKQNGDRASVRLCLQV